MSDEDFKPISKTLVFELEDLLNIIDYFHGTNNLSKSEIKKYDLNNDEILDVKDFILVIKSFLGGEFKYRTPENLYIFDKYIKKLSADKSLSAGELDYLNTEIKNIGKLYITKKEYPPEGPESVPKKRIVKLAKTLEKRGYSVKHIKCND